MGQQGVYGLPLRNKSGKIVNGLLELRVPAVIDVEVDDFAGQDVTALARLSRDTWVFTVDSDADDTGSDILILLEPKDDAAPGFYIITGRIVQVSG